MRAQSILIGAFAVGVITLAGAAGTAGAQPRPSAKGDCQSLRQHIAGHAQVSEGVRRLLGAPEPATAGTWRRPATPAPAAASGRADAIRARLAQIPGAREQLEGQRVAAVMQFDVSRAMRVQGELEALDRERVDLERELAGQPPAPPPAASPPSASPSWSRGDRVSCQDAAGTHAKAVTIRQRELGAREGQPGAIPLLALRGPGADQVARELHDQFAPWPAAADQIGLLDQDGDGRIDGFVDVPAEGVFRLYRQRPDGTLTVEIFTATTSPPGYSETTRRLDEAVVRQAGYTLVDLLGRRPAGPARMVGETAEFSRSLSGYLTGNFVDASRRESAGRTREFPNYRGEPIRVMDVIAPTAGGFLVRQLIMLPMPNDREFWEETTTQVRPLSSSQADVETTISRETRTAAGAVVAPRSTAAPIRFRLER